VDDELEVVVVDPSVPSAAGAAFSSSSGDDPSPAAGRKAALLQATPRSAMPTTFTTERKCTLPILQLPRRPRSPENPGLFVVQTPDVHDDCATALHNGGPC
jgi:hypothetical protein